MTPKTNAERQRARRQREKEWLKAYGFKSWEALHTSLMRGDHVIIKMLSGPPTGDYIIYPKKGKQS